MDYRQYSVSARHKQPLLDFILDALRSSGCRVIKSTPASMAPFRVTFEDPVGNRMGILVYAFFANSKKTKNRPDDEHRFQIKYGTKDGKLHEIWQDPYQLYTTLMIGVDTQRNMFVAIDPSLHNHTKFFISVEFKRSQVEQIQGTGWHCWERTRRSGDDAPIETMVGGTAARFLDFVKFEQAAQGLDPGHRFLLAEKLDQFVEYVPPRSGSVGQTPSPESVHELASEFDIGTEEILNIIQSAPRLKMAVRGWVAEHHLHDALLKTPGVTECSQLEADGQPDFELTYKDKGPFRVECKNVLRTTLADGTPRVDFQKTRASKNDPCSRFYRPSDFEVLAACLHPCTERWEFAFQLTKDLEFRTKTCRDHLNNNVKVRSHWETSVAATLDKLVG